MKKSAPQTKKVDDPLAEVFRRTGDVEAMTHWAKNHRAQFYGMYIRLVPTTQVTGNVSATVATDENAARLALEAALCRIIDARKFAPTVCIVDGQRLLDDGETIEHEPQPRVIEHEPQPRNGEPQSADGSPPSPASPPASADNVVKPRANEAPPQTQNSTAAFYEWFDSGGGGRMRHSDWGPV